MSDASLLNGSILVIEDNEPNRVMLVRRLRRRGFVVHEAGDAVTGLAVAREALPSVILMDMSLPGMDGWAATRALKADEATRAIAVLALTAHAMPQHRESAIEAGCDEFETKPINFDRLLDKIQRFLELQPC